MSKLISAWGNPPQKKVAEMMRTRLRTIHLLLPRHKIGTDFGRLRKGRQEPLPLYVRNEVSTSVGGTCLTAPRSIRRFQLAAPRPPPSPTCGEPSPLARSRPMRVTIAGACTLRARKAIRRAAGPPQREPAAGFLRRSLPRGNRFVRPGRFTPTSSVVATTKRSAKPVRCGGRGVEGIRRDDDSWDRTHVIRMAGGLG